MRTPQATTSIGEFTGALLGSWWTILSGLVSIPATFLALWVSNDVAKVTWGVTAFVSLWLTAYRLWKSEHDKVVERDQRKRQLLDEIPTMWQQKFGALENQIADKIEQLSSKAEAITYRNRGNIPRAINPNMGGYLWPHPLVDVCIYDLDYLKTFIHDYERGRDRK
jgi:hypothetical protein